jgi:integrase
LPDRLHVRRSATTGAGAAVNAPKSGRVRSVPMVPQVSEALARLGQREHFTGRGRPRPPRPGRPDRVRRTHPAPLRACPPRRRLPDALQFHDLLDVFGSTAVRAFPLSAVQPMLGHAHVTTTMRYVHHRPGADDAARLARAVGGAPVSPDVSRTGAERV